MRWLRSRLCCRFRGRRSCWLLSARRLRSIACVGNIARCCAFTRFRISPVAAVGLIATSEATRTPIARLICRRRHFRTRSVGIRRCRFRTIYCAAWTRFGSRSARCVTGLWSIASRFASTEDSCAPQIFIERSSRRAFRCASRSIGNFPTRKSSSWTIGRVAFTSTSDGDILRNSTATRNIYNFRITIDHSTPSRFVNAASTTIGISKVSPRQTRHATPWSIVTTIAAATSRTVMTIISIITPIVTIVTRTRISLVIRQRVPTNIVAERNVEHERDECRSPPTAMSVMLTSRTPCPIPIVVYPATVVVRRPTPRFIPDPCPAVRRTPRPMAITIRRPVGECADGCHMRPPDPAVVFGIGPITVSVEILCAPNVLVVILDVVL